LGLLVQFLSEEVFDMAGNSLNHLPVRVFRSENQYAVAAPMPGLEPEDITITIEAKRVTVHGKERGPGQHRRDLLEDDWNIGPYYREINLPEHVDGSLANATFGNGVLVITLPKAKADKADRTEFTLEALSPTRGERIGHMGHEIQPTTTSEHWERLSHIPKRLAV
jgi:HSP20 family protein